MLETARDRGIEPILRFSLPKHQHPIRNLANRRALASFLASNPYDVIHCHLDNDHRIALQPARKHGIPVVRTSYYGEGLPNDRRRAALLAETSWLIEPARQALESDVAAFGYPADRATVIPSAIDTDRFDPTRQVPDGRQWLGIPPDAFVVGIVARMQTHRRYEDFFEAIGRLVKENPKVHAIVVGRGTNQKTVGHDPVSRLGLEDHVHFPGYVGGENYVGMVKAFDAKVFLVPGSDGTCRAVREAMAMAKPAVVADRGMLREIVADGEEGFVIDGSPDSLFSALHTLRTNRAQAHAMGRAARDKALTAFSLDVQAKAVRDVYERVLQGD